ncbi:MAG TPA: hypothetical protein VGR21_04910 [Cryptosporangiaceae bacterium]|nr:hypothetical protein [Cryptosporangiaceae bacterium]
MPTEAEIDAALDAVIAAARAHRAIVRDGAEDEVWSAYVSLNNATVRYDDLISEAYDEVTPWDCEYLDAGEVERAATEPSAADIEPPAAVEATAILSVRHRRDYLVPDVPRLLRTASEARRVTWADQDTDRAQTAVANLGEAVYEIVHSGDGTIAALDAYPDELVPGNGVLLVNAVSRPLALGDPAEAEEDEPFRLEPADALLFRLDEEIVEEDAPDPRAENDLASAAPSGNGPRS